MGVCRCCLGLWLLFLHSLAAFTGQSKLVCSPQPIIALAGDDVILPCRLEAATFASDETLMWTKPELDPKYIYAHEHGQLVFGSQNPSYNYRTALFVDQLVNGNVSLKIFSLKLSDAGNYTCILPSIKQEALIQLRVGAVSTPVITAAEINCSSSSVVFQCESSGWYPEPELLWLDGDGNLLSAGPTETVRGPDDLYTVSSRVTVEKKHNNKFTCRVQQNNINQTREDLIHVPDDFFIIPYSSAVPIIVGLSVSLTVSIMFILASGFFLWRRNRTKTKRTFNKTEKDKEKKSSETEAEMLTSHEVVEMQDLEQKNPNNQHVTLQEPQQQQELQDPKEEIRETMVHDEIEMNQEAAEEELKGNQAADSQSTWYLLPSWNFFRGSQAEQPKKKEKDEDEMTSLQKKLEDLSTETEIKNKQLKDAQEEVNRRWKEFNDIRKESKIQLEEKNAEISEMKGELEEHIWKEKQNEEKYQKEINELLTMNKERKFQEERTKRRKAEKEVETLKKQLETKLDGSKSEDMDHQKESRQQNSSSSDHHTDLRDIILEEIDKNCKSVCLKNTSMKEKLLGGCKLQLHINNRELLIYTFDQSFTVKAGGRISLWNPQCSSEYPPTVDLVWKDLKPWNPEDQLQFFLFSHTGEFKELKFSD